MVKNQKFKLTTKFTPKGDQQQAIDQIVSNLKNNQSSQVLLGATGTGKTFTIANVIAQTQKKTLVLVHNKTLASQLYAEFKDLFKENKVEYFVSYFDFYQPEAYLPHSDTYIEKNSQVNQEIEMLRLSTINSIASANDVIVVASVAAIYPTSSPENFERHRIILSKNKKVNIKQLQYDLVKLLYQRNDIDLKPGTFRLKGDVLEIALGYADDYHLRLSFFGDDLEEIAKVDTLTGTLIEKWDAYVIAPASEYVANPEEYEESIVRIEKELGKTVKNFKNENKLVEAQRIEERTKHDIESIRELGYCSGIENYACHLELRQPGSTPYTIFDYFGDDWLLVVDESHMTMPQVRGMYFGDRARKQNLVNYGFRLPSALDNRPLNFDEFNSKLKQTIYVSATPAEYEINLAGKNNIVQQIVRPTGLVDPIIEIKPTKNQIDVLVETLQEQVKNKQRTIITVLTIRMAEELSNFLKEKNFKVAYLHNELKTLHRTKIINDLRRGTYDTVVGINLLREGLDVPEVSLAIIFDADKPGIFRSYESLIQIFGRTARNVNARVIMFSDKMTPAMEKAIYETNRRRSIQTAYNQQKGITPTTIVKEIFDDLSSKEDTKIMEAFYQGRDKITDKNKSKAIAMLKKQMLIAAKEQNYEKAAHYRDMIMDFETKLK